MSMFSKHNIERAQLAAQARACVVNEVDYSQYAALVEKNAVSVYMQRIHTLAGNSVAACGDSVSEQTPARSLVLV